MCDQKRCYAPIKGGKRCPNFTLSNKLHCEEHFPKGLQLYNSYKEVCNKTDLYSVNHISKYETLQQKIRYLHEFYCLLIRAYKGRLLHKNYGFVPELFDRGHDRQFEIIMETISVIEDNLSSLYEEFTRKPEVKEEIQIDVPEVEMVIEKVRTFKRKRVDDSKVIESTLNKYIKENKKFKEEMDDIVSKCLNLLIKLCKGDNYSKLFGLYHLIGRLHDISYFVVEYKPVKCCSECTDFMLYEAKITCSCISEHDNMKDFLNDIHIDSLKSFYDIMTNNKYPIRYICDDYNSLWKTYGEDVMDTNIKLMWNKTLGRLTLKREQDLDLTKRQHEQMDMSHKRFVISNKSLTNSILSKFRSRDFYCRFVDGETSNCNISNLRKVSLQDAMDNIDTWVVDWSIDLTKAERDLVLTPEWRAGLSFRKKTVEMKKVESLEKVMYDLD